MSAEPPHALDRLKHRLLRRPAVAWAVLVFTVLTSLLAVLPRLRDVIGLVPSPPTLHLAVRTHDPRFQSAGEWFNWGGGSQAIWLSDGHPPIPPENLGELSEALLSDRLRHAGSHAPPVWEVIPPGDADGMIMMVDAALSAGATDNAVIREWGVRARAIPGPADGTYLHYLTGGASSGRDGGIVRVTAPGDAPVHTWVTYDGGLDAERPRAPTIEYLEPGEIKGMILNISGSVIQPERTDSTGDPLPPPALLLTIYAKVWSGGRLWEIESTDGIRALLPGTAAYRAYQVTDSALIEDLRPGAVVTR